MKNKQQQRDMQLQAQYREALTNESINLYGIARCFASKKPYKGLIASHIKPYRLCVLEGDEASMFDPNNGLLLAKFIDDYFDKLLVTFDDNGNMVFSDSIPDEIKDEFRLYSLGKEVYNEIRRSYMQIHRSLFYYKNYMRRDDSIKMNVPLSIPYVDCGIRIYNGKAIICNDNRWETLPVFHLKAALAERARKDIKLYAYASGAEVFSAISKNEQYVLRVIPEGFNTPNQTVNITNLNEVVSPNEFKLCSANYDLKEGFPKRFYDFLVGILSNESDIVTLRKIIAAALHGRAVDKYVIINGAEESVDSLCRILRAVFGSYIADIISPKILLAGNPSEYSIPNCRLLICNMRHKYISPHIMEDVVQNRFFTSTVLNLDHYLPIFICSSKRPVDNSIVIELKKGNFNANVDMILEEGGEILNWFLTVQDMSIDYSSSFLPISAEGGVKEWFDKCCINTNDTRDILSATVLYNAYQVYMKEKGFSPVSIKRFSIEMQKRANKKRGSAGIIYFGIKIKIQ